MTLIQSVHLIIPRMRIINLTNKMFLTAVLKYRPSSLVHKASLTLKEYLGIQSHINHKIVILGSGIIDHW